MEKDFINPSLDRGLTSKVCEELKKLDINKLNDQLKWGYRSQYRILKKGISNVSETVIEMFNRCPHQELDFFAHILTPPTLQLDFGSLA